MDSLKQLEKYIFSLKELVENFESKLNTEEDLLNVIILLLFYLRKFKMKILVYVRISTIRI